MSDYHHNWISVPIKVSPTDWSFVIVDKTTDQVVFTNRQPASILKSRARAKGNEWIKWHKKNEKRISRYTRKAKRKW